MLIEEDGTGLPNSNSYAARAKLASFATDRGITLTGTNADQDAALILGTDYVDTHYLAAGDPLEPDQALRWPRAGSVALDPRVIRATILLAIEALKGPLCTDTSTRGIKSLKEALDGVGSTETVYDDAAPAGDPYPAVTAILAPLTTSASTVWVGRTK